MKPETRWALFILALSIIWKMLLLLTGWNDSVIGKYPLLPVFGFMLIGMFRGMEERRKLDYIQTFSFPGLFKSGMSIAALFTLTYSLFLYVYLNYLDAGFKSRMIAARIAEQLRENPDTSPEMIKQWTDSTAGFPFASIWILFTFIGLMVLGAFYAGIITRMMRKKHMMLLSGKVN